MTNKKLNRASVILIILPIMAALVLLLAFGQMAAASSVSGATTVFGATTGVSQPAVYSLVVTTTADSGTGSLRWAVQKAMNGDNITFHNSLDGDTITLTGTDIQITKTLNIDASALTETMKISGENNGRIFEVTDTGVVTLTHLKLINGSVADSGGAITNEGKVTLVDSTVYNNKAGILIGVGGGIANGGTGELVIDSSTISSNTAKSGGGIYNFGQMTIKLSTIDHNAAYQGGGIYASEATNYVYTSTISTNEADDKGGGLFASASDTLLSSNTFFENEAPASGGINVGNGQLWLSQNIIAGSDTGADCLVSPGSVMKSNLYNLIEDGSCNTNAVGLVMGNPLLSELGANNTLRSTYTHRILHASSPAADAVASGSCRPIDQRGYSRPRQSSPTGPILCDIGAVEFVYGLDEGEELKPMLYLPSIMKP